MVASCYASTRVVELDRCDLIDHRFSCHIKGNVGQRLNKKGGNFIGELVSNFNKTDYTLVTRDQVKL
jgi:hypothetical protein